MHQKNKTVNGDTTTKSSPSTIRRSFVLNKTSDDAGTSLAILPGCVEIIRTDTFLNDPAYMLPPSNYKNSNNANSSYCFLIERRRLCMAISRCFKRTKNAQLNPSITNVYVHFLFFRLFAVSVYRLLLEICDPLQLNIAVISFVITATTTVFRRHHKYSRPLKLLTVYIRLCKFSQRFRKLSSLNRSVASPPTLFIYNTVYSSDFTTRQRPNDLFNIQSVRSVSKSVCMRK